MLTLKTLMRLSLYSLVLSSVSVTVLYNRDDGSTLDESTYLELNLSHLRSCSIKFLVQHNMELGRSTESDS